MRMLCGHCTWLVVFAGKLSAPLCSHLQVSEAGDCVVVVAVTGEGKVKARTAAARAVSCDVILLRLWRASTVPAP